MQVTVELPDEFLTSLVPEGLDASRLLLEESVAAAYRNRRLTTDQVRQLLGFDTLMQVDVFMGQHDIYDYTSEDLDKDLATMDHLFA